MSIMYVLFLFIQKDQKVGLPNISPLLRHQKQNRADF